MPHLFGPRALAVEAVNELNEEQAAPPLLTTGRYLECALGTGTTSVLNFAGHWLGGAVGLLLQGSWKKDVRSLDKKGES